MQSPVAVSSPLVLAEIRLSGEGSLVIDTEHREVAILAIDGALTVAGRTLPTGHLAVLEPGARPALAGRGHAMVLGGDPLGHRRIWWNFVHSDPARIEEAKQRWADQQFPRVPGDHDPWVALPR